MKLTIQSVSPTKRTIMSYRLTFGSRRARQLGFLNQDGTGKEIIPIQSKNGYIFVPVDNKGETLSYRNHETVICQHNGLFCGEVYTLPDKPTWFSRSLQEATQAFHSCVDKAIG